LKDELVPTPLPGGGGRGTFHLTRLLKAPSNLALKKKNLKKLIMKECKDFHAKWW